MLTTNHLLLNKLLKVHPTPIFFCLNKSTYDSKYFYVKMVEFGSIFDLLWATKVSFDLLHDQVKGSLGPARLVTSSCE